MMEFFNFLMFDVLSEPAVLVGLIALIGLIAQKKPVTECIKGTVKTIMGQLAPLRGQVHMAGKALQGRPSYKVALAGVLGGLWAENQGEPPAPQEPT